MVRVTSAHARAALRSLPRMLFGSAAATLEPLRIAHQGIRTPLALARRVGFVQFSGGVGASTLAAGVLATLAACRPTTSLAVDAAGGQLSLLDRLGVSNRDAEEDELLEVHPRIAGIELVSGALPRVAARHADWLARVEPIARFHDLVVTDWGHRPALDDLAATAASSHVLVLVSRSERDALEQAAALLPALRLLTPRPRVLLAATDIGGAGRRADLSRISGALNIPGFRIPFDASRGQAPVLHSPDTSLRSRIALAELTAAVVREAERSLIAAPTLTPVPAPTPTPTPTPTPKADLA